MTFPAPFDESGSGITALVVEDDPQWAELVARVLSNLPGVGETVSKGSLLEGVRWSEEHAPRLIFLDLNLPDSAGMDTLRRVRRACPGAAMVVMTGDAEESTGLQALREGAQDYLVKGRIEAAMILRTARYALERRRLELALESSMRLLTSTLDSLPACIAILDLGGKIVAVNEAWSRYRNPGNPLIHGVEPGENYFSVCDRSQGMESDRIGDASQETSESSIHAVAKGILQVSTGMLDRFDLDYSVPSPSGPAWCAVVVTRFSSPTDSHVVVFHLDISGRKELETKLRASEDLFRVISENVVDLMAIIDAEGRRFYTSPSYFTVLGYSSAEMATLSSSELLHPEDKPTIAGALGRLFEHGRLDGLEYRLRHKNGTWMHFDSNGALIANPDGGIPRALIVARDVTERKKAEAEHLRMELQLRQAQRLEAVGSLAAGIAHEINTPTQFIGDNTRFVRDNLKDVFAFLEQLKQECQGERHLDKHQILGTLEQLDMDYMVEEMPKALHQSLEGLAQVSKIVNAMKDFSHPGGDIKERMDLNKAIENTVTVSRNEWKYVARMELDLAPTLPLVPCILGEFNQAILNLVVNAAHAIEEALGNLDSGEKGTIRIRTREAGPFVEIRIQDTGVGIPEAIRNRIFDPFFTTKPVGKGTGQGLAMVHSIIVERHFGSIDVESEVGVGTTLILALPIEDGVKP